MATLVLEDEVRIPERLTGLRAFRRWVRSPEFPTRGRFAFLAGEVWVEMSPEEMFWHNQVKGEIGRVLAGLALAPGLGRYFHDRVLVSNPKANLSTEPDGTFVSFEALRDGRVRWVKGEEGYVEMEGTPDMVLEVVSSSSVRKDTIVLRELYWLAGVREYWLVDARGGALRFDLLRRTRAGYASAPARDGWRRSRVFSMAFELTSRQDEMGYPQYLLRAR